MDLFEVTDYREAVRKLLELRGKGKRGQTSLLATHLGVNAAFVSQVLSGKKQFSEDQAFATAKFLGLNQKETYYLVVLVQADRAGNHQLKELLGKQIFRMRQEARSIKGRMHVERELTFEEQAVYYSHWMYTAVAVLVSVPGLHTRRAIGERLKIEGPMLDQVIGSLLEYELVKEENGRLSVGPATTYVSPESPLVVRHHQNWRQKAQELMLRKDKRDFYFTAPLTISARDFEKFTQRLVEIIGELQGTVEKTKPEEVACINIDFFRVT